MIRTFLFAPADDARKMSKALNSGADAVIFDLEDSVAASRKAFARDCLAEFLASKPSGRIWVRINELASDHAKPDFDSLPGDGVSGLLIPKPRTAQDLSRMGQLIADARSNGKNHADLALMPIATEVPEALFHILDIAKAEHVRYLTWGAEDLAAAVGALSNTDEHGRFTPTFVYARTQCLLAASAANIVPVDAASMQIHDSEALKAECQAARRDGFVGKLAIHPAQIDVIHEAFAPSADELEWAQKVIAAFDEDPDRGAFRIDGKMIDKPHLRIAQRIVDAAQIGAA